MACERTHNAPQEDTRHCTVFEYVVCKRFHLRSDSHGPLTLQARLLAHFQTQLAPPAVRVLKMAPSFWRLRMGLKRRWNRIKTGCYRNVEIANKWWCGIKSECCANQVHSGRGVAGKVEGESML